MFFAYNATGMEAGKITNSGYGHCHHVLHKKTGLLGLSRVFHHDGFFLISFSIFCITTKVSCCLCWKILRFLSSHLWYTAAEKASLNTEALNIFPLTFWAARSSWKAKLRYRSSNTTFLSHAATLVLRIDNQRIDDNYHQFLQNKENNYQE